MKKILISIKPKYVAEILNHRKTLEIRKTAPKCELPCEVYIYCTNGREVIKPSKTNPRYEKIKSYSPKKGCVCAKFTLNKVDKIEYHYHRTLDDWDGYFIGRGALTNIGEIEIGEKACLNHKQLNDYLKEREGYAWHIDQKSLVIFDRPKELSEFEFPNPSGIRYIGQRAIKGLPSKKRPPQSWCYCEVDE